MGTLEESDPRLRITARNEIIDRLRNNKVLAVKTADTGLEAGFEPSPQFGWTSSMEQDVIGNSTSLNEWKPSPFRWDYSSNLESIKNASELWAKEFVDFHEQNSLELHRTLDSDIDHIPDEILKVLWRGEGRRKRERRFQEARDAFRELAKNRTREALREYQKKVESEIDGLSVKIAGADPLFSAWTCGVDVSIKPYIRNQNHVQYQRCMSLYRVPGGSRSVHNSFLSLDEDGKPVLDGDGRHVLIKNPLELYAWYPGELRTPILNYNQPASLNTIRMACAALRNNFRIHKPTSAIQSGLHIHFGQDKGYGLLHLKKFSTLWLILEESLERLHRRDRSNESNRYCLPNRVRSPIAVSLKANTRDDLSAIEEEDPEAYKENMAEMNNHVPFTPDEGDTFNLGQIRNIIHEVWKYQTVSEVTDGMSGVNSPYVKYHISGKDVSKVQEYLKGTLEIRLMQGTLDAEHILRWMKICERIIIYSRDTTARQFRNGILRILSLEPFNKVIGIPDGIMEWFREQQGISGYFEYPDEDRVDWEDPFMVPGHGATHR
ncbi:hypothetical protein F5Y00DRAFT_272439 [Daldinia vernicosa]|uniref:uncharacterized protein n=1 Tax=Daldinia vernicosa TaxID=114800 RepID=UPI002007DF51|nr:uncharacterized protein F5Y00DRAFT_272439 [Daldinia vernicosa]KAI0852807.1 hypothetical protein F5Y00DRAFT_272439 [Daldinia vernicosa]